MRTTNIAIALIVALAVHCSVKSAKAADLADSFENFPTLVMDILLEGATLNRELPGSTLKCDMNKSFNFSGIVRSESGIDTIEIVINGAQGNSTVAFVAKPGGEILSLSDYFFIPGEHWSYERGDNDSVTLRVTDFNDTKAEASWPIEWYYEEQPNLFFWRRGASTESDPDNNGPVYMHASLGGETLELLLSSNDKVYFQGTVSDSSSVQNLYLDVFGPGEEDYDLAMSRTPSQTEASFSNFYFDPTDSSYAGKSGRYTVALWAKDSAGNATSRTWSVVVEKAEPEEPQEPADTTPIFSGATLDGVKAGGTVSLEWTGTEGSALRLGGTLSCEDTSEKIILRQELTLTSGGQLRETLSSGSFPPIDLSSYTVNLSTYVSGRDGSRSDFTLTLIAENTDGETARVSWPIRISITEDWKSKFEELSARVEQLEAESYDRGFRDGKDAVEQTPSSNTESTAASYSPYFGRYALTIPTVIIAGTDKEYEVEMELRPHLGGLVFEVTSAKAK